MTRSWNTTTFTTLEFAWSTLNREKLKFLIKILIFSIFNGENKAWKGANRMSLIRLTPARALKVQMF